ncbi:hypothetical protein DFS34DRAFT_653986 [Phlyctochytrium arcticum]|nr:hypothetical protein DFS34DRAFT_653986 [Phlyctochytrium arcticum]
MGALGAPLHEVIEISELKTSTSQDALHQTVEEKFLAYHHLTADEAQRRLLAAADEVLVAHRIKTAARHPRSTAVLRQSNICAVLFALGLVAFFAFSKVRSDPYQWRATGALVEAGLLLLAVTWNIWLQIREWRLTALEMSMRIQSIIEPMREFGLSRRMDLKYPTTIPTVSISRVIRDQSMYLLPFNLVVEDDIVQMAYGDVAPCRIRYVHSHFDNAAHEEREYILAKGQIFKPSLFSSSPDPTVMRRAAVNEGQFHFRAMETPLKDTLQKSLDFERPETVIAHQFKVIKKYYFKWLFWIVLGISFSINVLRYGIRNAKDASMREQGIEMLVNLQAYAVLPLLPLVIPTLYIILRSYGNAQILALFDALQTSKDEFEDQEDVDEFDAAPPPTKDLILDWGLVWKRFLSQFASDDVTFLARTTGLVASLANTTVICTIDREGTISLPTPSPDQLFFCAENGEPVLLDLAEDSSDHIVRFQDKDWQDYLALLKPLGLNMLLNTDCGAATGRVRLEHHRKSNGMHLHGCVKAGRQACLCQVGRQIGFSLDALRMFVSERVIHTFAPYFPTVGQGPDYHFEIPSCLSQIFKDVSSDSYQVFSEGNVGLILDHCTDFWNGKGIENFDETMRKKVLEFHQNALVCDSQTVAFSYRPIENEAMLCLLNHHSASAQTRSPSDSIYHEVSNSPEELQLRSLNRLTLPTEGGLAMEKTPSGRAKARLNKKRYLSNAACGHSQEDRQLCYEVTKGQTFLGMASLAYLPKANVINFIEDLGLAGIRFVYFSSAGERESKAYAERLGLEIDWNSCILLSPDNGETPGYLELHDMKAKLPRGVDKIRDHIQNVDDVPLHVSLFAECSPSSVREMVKIFQEYGEVVCCIGSSLNEMNVECFALADVSIAIDPLSILKARNHSLTGPLSPFHVGAGLTSLPCAFSLHNDTSVYSLTQLIREARTIADNGRQAFLFYIAAQTSLCVIMLLSYCLLLPPIFQGYQLLFLLWIILPILSLSFVFSPHDPKVMTMMPIKNLDHLSSRWRFLVYFLIRFSVVILLSLVLFAISLAEYSDEVEATATDILGNFGGDQWNQWTEREQWALLYAQNSVMYFWVYIMVCISATFLHRTQSIRKFRPYRNKVWLLACVVCLSLQTVFTALSLGAPPSHPYKLSVLPWWMYLTAFVLAPPVCVSVQEIVKKHDKREWEKFQKRSKLEFNTKL